MTADKNDLGLSARDWGFLHRPESYVATSARLAKAADDRQAVRPLVLESTKRQFRTAADILRRLVNPQGNQRGVLLADDVGLGKTTVAALVAWVVASAGTKRSVRILVPNDPMVRRWTEELRAHVALLNELAPRLLDVREARVKPERALSLRPGTIQVIKHSYASSDSRLACDLLIIDEAHRAKGAGTQFSAALQRQRRAAKRVLILTATPFSIRLEELTHLLSLVGADHVKVPVREFSKALDDLYGGSTARDAAAVAKELVAKARLAIEAIQPYVIRHGVGDLPRERRAFGEQNDWPLEVRDANADELELLARMIRAKRLEHREAPGDEGQQVANDPRFHVGWRLFDDQAAELKAALRDVKGPDGPALAGALAPISRLRKRVGEHAKMRAVAAEVVKVTGRGEKVVLFCHHITVAQELTVLLSRGVGRKQAVIPPQPVWHAAWMSVLGPLFASTAGEELDNFIAWLCTRAVRQQVWPWLALLPSATTAELERALRRSRARGQAKAPTVERAAERLLSTLLRSRSSHGVLSMQRDDFLRAMPGGAGASPVLGTTEPDDPANGDLFVRNRQPDTMIALFNSPFGPEVLVATDKHSEGIDLHQCCRHLIHYELDPSPVRTVQRNGRLRRVGSWASVTGAPMLVAYPAFGGTRDEKLVQIMKQRVSAFSMLLGGVRDVELEAIESEDELWRESVVTLVRKRHAKGGRALGAR